VAGSRKNETRILDSSESEMVAMSRRPQLQELGGKELADLLARLRERRDRARDIANRQRRAVRGKSGDRATFEHADAGNRQKAGALAAAVARVNKEHARRSAD
jgi:hypothetical protein